MKLFILVIALITSGVALADSGYTKIECSAWQMDGQGNPDPRGPTASAAARLNPQSPFADLQMGFFRASFRVVYVDGKAWVKMTVSRPFSSPFGQDQLMTPGQEEGTLEAIFGDDKVSCRLGK